MAASGVLLCGVHHTCRKVYLKFLMQAFDGPALAAMLRSHVPDASFEPEHAQALLQRYQQLPIPNGQTTAMLNKTVRDILHISSNTRLRAELVILQVLIRTHGIERENRTPEELVQTYGFNLDDVQQDATLSSFDWYMGFVLELVCPDKHRAFIVQEVVVPLSDAPGTVYVTGGGTETTATTNRHFIFEHRTGLYRPKTLERLQGHMPPPYPQTAGAPPPPPVQTEVQAIAMSEGTESEDESDITQYIDLFSEPIDGNGDAGGDSGGGGLLDMLLPQANGQASH